MKHYTHIDRIFEASWAPDDIINDKSVFHIFKLFKAGLSVFPSLPLHRRRPRADAIGSVISVWMCIWFAANEGR